MMEQLLGDLGGKPLAPGEFSWWDVGQVLRPCPSSITPRKYLVSTKGCDGAATGLSLWSLQPATCCLGHRPPFPQRFPRVTPRLVSPVKSLFWYSKGQPGETAFGVSAWFAVCQGMWFPFHASQY